MNKKYEIEKVLHEIIRDLPAAQKAEKMFAMGYLTADDTLDMIAKAFRTEKENEKSDKKTGRKMTELDKERQEIRRRKIDDIMVQLFIIDRRYYPTEWNEYAEKWNDAIQTANKEDREYALNKISEWETVKGKNIHRKADGTIWIMTDY